MKLACQFANGQWCGHLHPLETPNHLLCQAAHIHRVPGDATGPEPWKAARRSRGAPKGNRNAAKAPDAPRYTGQITLRLTPELKTLVDDVAGSEGANAWIRRAIEEKLEREKSASVP